jgi:hypothetical protein
MAVKIRQLVAPSLVPNTNQTFYTCPANTKAVFRALSLHNSSAGNVTIEVWVVPTGQSAANGYKIAKVTLAANISQRLTEVEGLVLAEGDMLQTLGSVNGASSIIGGGVEVT